MSGRSSPSYISSLKPLMPFPDRVFVIVVEGEGGRSLLLSIHQLNDAEHVCDRFVLLAGGRVRGVGTRDELRERAARPSGSLEDIFLALT